MESNKPFEMELILKQNKKVVGKKKKIKVSITKEEVRAHLLEYLSPYQDDLLRNEIKSNSIDLGYLVTEICKHNSKYSSTINAFFYDAKRELKIDEKTKADFVNYLKDVLKMNDTDEDEI